MKEKEIQAAMIGLLFVRGEEGLTVQEAAEVMDLTKAACREQLEEVKSFVDEHIPGLTVEVTEDTYRFMTEEKIAPFIETLTEQTPPSKLSQAALETLAVIAYNQPTSRVDIERIRGVKSERALQTLLERNLIEEAGRKETIGRPILYQTTDFFLEYFQLNSLEELPSLEELDTVEIEEEKIDLFFDTFPSDRGNQEQESDRIK